jgi:hypothetical protein
LTKTATRYYQDSADIKKRPPKRDFDGARWLIWGRWARKKWAKMEKNAQKCEEKCEKMEKNGNK